MGVLKTTLLTLLSGTNFCVPTAKAYFGARPSLRTWGDDYPIATSEKTATAYDRKPGIKRASCAAKWQLDMTLHRTARAARASISGQ
jgi:hypothetical protein